MIPGPMELGLILVIVLVLFGAGKLPQVFEAFGKGIKSFRDAQKDDPLEDDPPKAIEVDAKAVRDAEEVGDKAAARRADD